jgi:hypothetical protein
MNYENVLINNLRAGLKIYIRYVMLRVVGVRTLIAWLKGLIPYLPQLEVGGALQATPDSISNCRS